MESRIVGQSPFAVLVAIHRGLEKYMVNKKRDKTLRRGNHPISVFLLLCLLALRKHVDRKKSVECGIRTAIRGHVSINLQYTQMGK